MSKSDWNLAYDYTRDIIAVSGTWNETSNSVNDIINKSSSWDTVYNNMSTMMSSSQTASMGDITAQSASFSYFTSSGGGIIKGEIGNYTAEDGTTRAIGLRVTNDISASGFKGEFFEFR